MSENVPLQLLVALGHAATTDAGGHEGDKLFALGLVEHGVRLGVTNKTGKTPSDDNADAKDGRITTSSCRAENGMSTVVFGHPKSEGGQKKDASAG